MYPLGIFEASVFEIFAKGTSVLLPADKISIKCRARFIFTGYRQPTTSYTTCIRSIFAYHNESVNVWSHVIGTFYFFSMLLRLLSITDDELKFEDKLLSGLMLFGCGLSMMLSTLYHLFNCQPLQTRNIWRRLDHIGMAIAMTCCYLPLIYYGFYQDSRMMLKQALCIGLVVIGTMFYVIFFPQVICDVFGITKSECTILTFVSRVSRGTEFMF